jgi:hypothetical protein
VLELPWRVVGVPWVANVVLGMLWRVVGVPWVANLVLELLWRVVGLPWVGNVGDGYVRRRVPGDSTHPALRLAARRPGRR